MRWRLWHTHTNQQTMRTWQAGSARREQGIYCIVKTRGPRLCEPWINVKHVFIWVATSKEVHFCCLLQNADHCCSVFLQMSHELLVAAGSAEVITG